VLINEHGGVHGLGNEDALEATLARPRQLLAYRPNVTIYDLAASYGYGFARDHVFADGNKRIALAAVAIFLQLNGLRLIADEAETVVIFNEVAAGRIDENGLAAWIIDRSEPFDLDID